MPPLQFPEGCDRLRTARRLVCAVVFGSVLMVGGMAAHGALGGDRMWQPARAVLEALHLSTLSLVPAGRPERLPSVRPVGIDLRHAPELALPPMDNADLLIRRNSP